MGAPKLRSGNFGPKHFRGQVREWSWEILRKMDPSLRWGDLAGARSLEEGDALGGGEDGVEVEFELAGIFAVDEAEDSGGDEFAA